MRVVFDVEQAGCESCGRLITAALTEIGTVESIALDEDVDVATVVLSGRTSRTAVDSALEKASAGAGHAYRVRPASWRRLGEASSTPRAE
jgi:hypothetical protein